MRQQINLYQVTRPITLPVAAQSLLLVTLLLSTALLGFWGYGLRTVHGLQQQADLVTQQQNARVRMLEQGSAWLAAQVEPLALRQEVQQLSNRVAQRQLALLALRRIAPAAQSGFATRLTALAQPHVAGVWLDHIVLRDGPGIDTLGGRSVDATLVASYLRALGTEPALQGARFSEVRILGAQYVDPETAAATDPNTEAKPKFTPPGVRFQVDAKPISTDMNAGMHSGMTGSPT